MTYESNCLVLSNYSSIIASITKSKNEEKRDFVEVGFRLRFDSKTIRDSLEPKKEFLSLREFFMTFESNCLILSNYSSIIASITKSKNEEKKKFC